MRKIQIFAASQNPTVQEFEQPGIGQESFEEGVECITSEVLSKLFFSVIL